ncbi:2'-5' RNA ligase family protein [Curtobacterium sp. MCBD17_021]|uniref:2'-5' RNA ligase family protein n=1 Tax=Curtobacterium sp. MCBD17_021 TaxID=2175665 RepID=UPI000DAA487F|nr:2'-5' RNA ligase family protein [Curtobacterium sp. MCBD17_021]PZE68272.1 2'-5' RNA ligase family protein [Curtobacterium sp. MCBD17_021]
MRSIELVLDPAAERAVRGAWGALVTADLPSMGRHTSDTNAPHVTLTAGEALPVPTAFDAPLPATVRPAGLLLFPAGPGRHVLGVGIVVDRALAAFHEAVHRAAPGGVDTALPGRWVPHLTLARRPRDVDLPRMLEVLAAVPLPEELGVAGVRHWDGETKTVTPLG